MGRHVEPSGGQAPAATARPRGLPGPPGLASGLCDLGEVLSSSEREERFATRKTETPGGAPKLK